MQTKLRWKLGPDGYLIFGANADTDIREQKNLITLYLKHPTLMQNEHTHNVS